MNIANSIYKALSYISLRIVYRAKQFRSVLFPIIDENALCKARLLLPESWRPHFDVMGGPEKAHVLRLLRAIEVEPSFSESERRRLSILALTHDFGKAITKPCLFERIIRALLPIPNEAHPAQSAKILRRLGAPKDLIRQVRLHHRQAHGDRILELFQKLDDSL